MIDHHGPVFAQGTEDQYRIEFRPETTPSSWSEVTDLFVVDTTKTATSGATTNRKVYIKPAVGNATGFSAPGWYRFRPEPGKIRCANVTGNPDVAYDSNITAPDSDDPGGTAHDWYQFRVRLAYCPGGFAFEGGQVNATDIAQWMEEPFEVNCDGQICEQDLADMLSAYNN